MLEDLKRTCLGLLIFAFILTIDQPAYGIPAFAPKYGLRCSACHEAWPKLNNFGQVFKDNGYQLMNDRDAPIWQNLSYFPVSVRVAPQWHRENANRMALDQTPGVVSSHLTEANITTSGFDLSGLDLWTAGTLYKNISFSVLPSFDADGTFHFENTWVRFDNLLRSPWLNFKLGKFELDIPDSEKRILTLSQNGGYFQVYHYRPLTGDINTFGGIGDNQLGIELMGHSRNSYTRYAVSLTSSNDGQPGLPTNSGYDLYGDVSQAWEWSSLGLQRVGTLAYYGHSPTYYLTLDGVPIPGTGRGNRPFYRFGAYGDWHVHKWLFNTTYLRGKDNAFSGHRHAGQPGAAPGRTGPDLERWFRRDGLLLEPAARSGGPV